MLDPDTIALLKQLGYSADSIESALSGMLYLTVLTLVTALLAGIVAKRKNRSVGGWVLFALSIPVIPLLLVWLLPKLPDKPKS